MKDKIIIFIIGFLVGSVISTGIFCAYTLVNNSNNSNNNQMQMNGGPPEKPDGDNNGTPPELPSGQTQNNNETK